MNREIVKSAPAYKVEIFIAGMMEPASQICRSFCDEVGLCVTVTPISYVYTGGEEYGVIIGLINYPRFPKSQDEIYRTALKLARKLRSELGQGSFTIQDHKEAVFYSIRDEDQN